MIDNTPPLLLNVTYHNVKNKVNAVRSTDETCCNSRCLSFLLTLRDFSWKKDLRNLTWDISLSYCSHCHSYADLHRITWITKKWHKSMSNDAVPLIQHQERTWSESRADFVTPQIIIKPVFWMRFLQISLKSFQRFSEGSANRSSNLLNDFRKVLWNGIKTLSFFDVHVLLICFWWIH